MHGRLSHASSRASAFTSVLGSHVLMDSVAVVHTLAMSFASGHANVIKPSDTQSWVFDVKHLLACLPICHKTSSLMISRRLRHGSAQVSLVSVTFYMLICIYVCVHVHAHIFTDRRHILESESGINELTRQALPSHAKSR